VATSIDYRPLIEPPAKEAVAAFRAAHRGAPGYGGSPGAAAIAVAIGVLIALFGVLAAGGTTRWLAIAVGGVVAAFGVAGLVLAARRWPRETRLDAFARANGLLYYPRTGDPGYPGAIFGRGSGRGGSDHLLRTAGRLLDYGNYQYTTGSGKNRQTHEWWFLAMQLDRALPHMVLDSKANDGLFGATSLPVAFARDQVLHLEGDFDRHFTLYCPREYERDALYVFTPDLMAACIDEAGTLDLEIVDRFLFAYSRGHLDMADPAVQRRVWRLVDTVGERLLEQSEHYADENVGGRAAFAANVVAPRGARLRRGLNVAGVVATVVIAAIVLLPRLLGLFQ